MPTDPPEVPPAPCAWCVRASIIMTGVQEHLSYTKTQFPCCSLTQGKSCFEPLCTTEADTVKLTSCVRVLSGTHARHHDPGSRLHAGLCPNVRHPEALTPSRALHGEVSTPICQATSAATIPFTLSHIGDADFSWLLSGHVETCRSLQGPLLSRPSPDVWGGSLA